MISPKNIESLIQPETLIKVLNLDEINDLRVNSIVCPICKRGRMFIFHDPITDGYNWYCPVCDKSLSSLQLYQKIRKLPNLNLAWTNLISEAGVGSPHVDYSADIIELQNYLQLIETIYTTFDDSVRRITSGYFPEIQETLENLGWVNTVNQYDFENTLCKFVGSASSKVFGNYILTHLDRKTRNHNTRLLSRNCLMIPFEYSPQITAGFHLIDRDLKRQSNNLMYDEQLFSSGILGLKQAILSGIDSVVAVTDIDLFMNMQRIWAISNTKPAPVICLPSPMRNGFPVADTSLFNLPHKEVVLWDRGFNMDIINYCRFFENAGGIYMEEVDEASDFTPFSMAGNITNAATNENKRRGWPYFLKKWITSQKISDPKALVKQLTPALSNSEIDLLKKEWGESTWNKLNKLFDVNAGMLTRIVNVHGDTFVLNKLDGVSRFIDDRNTEFVSDCWVDILEVITSGEDVYVSGFVHYQDKEPIKFSETLDRVKNNTEDFITYKIASFHGLPKINKKYKEDLYDIFLAFSSPKAITTSTKVGWFDLDKTWNFPKFCISGGKFSTYKDTPIHFDKLPCSTIDFNPAYPPKSQLKELWREKDEDVLLAWALMLVVITNACAPMIGRNKISAAIIGENQATHDLMNFIGSMFNLSSFHNVDNKKKTAMVDAIIDEEHRHDMPILVKDGNLNYSPWKDWIMYSDKHNTILNTCWKDGYTMITQPKWVFLDIAKKEEFYLPKTFESMSVFLPLYIRHLQESKSYVRWKTETPLIRSIASDFEEFLRTLYPGVNTHTIISAYQKFIIPPEETASRLLWGVFYAIAVGKIAIKVVASTKDIQWPVVRLSNGSYYINWIKVRTVFNNMDMVVPDREFLHLSAKQSQDWIEETQRQLSWIITQEVWDEHFNKWHREIGHQFEVF